MSASIEGRDFSDAAIVPPSPKGSLQKRLDHPLRLTRIGISSGDAEHVGLIVFGGQGCRFGVPGDGRANSMDFIRRYSHSYSRTADKYAPRSSA